MKIFVFSIFLKLILFTFFSVNCKDNEEDKDENDPYKTTDPKKREPSPCEICKFLVTELDNRLLESAGSKEVLEMGQWTNPRKKTVKYLTSELRLTEALHEPHICKNILQYNVHAERKGSMRYGKGMSQTMKTLHGLVDKGVKVDLGIPYELWNEPSAEVSKMHKACFTFAESVEEDIEDWYHHHQQHYTLLQYICQDRYLKHKDQACLSEVIKSKGDPGTLHNGEKEGEGEEEEVDDKHHATKKNKKNNKNKDKSDGKDKKNKNELKFTTPSPVREYPGEVPIPPNFTTPIPRSSREDGDL